MKFTNNKYEEEINFEIENNIVYGVIINSGALLHGIVQAVVVSP